MQKAVRILIQEWQQFLIQELRQFLNQESVHFLIQKVAESWFRNLQHVGSECGKLYLNNSRFLVGHQVAIARKLLCKPAGKHLPAATFFSQRIQDFLFFGSGFPAIPEPTFCQFLNQFSDQFLNQLSGQFFRGVLCTPSDVGKRNPIPGWVPLL